MVVVKKHEKGLRFFRDCARQKWPWNAASILIITRHSMKFHMMGLLKNERRTSNVQHRIMNSANLIKDWAKRINPSKFDSAESLDPESFNAELTTEGPVAGCDSLVLKSVKRSVINIDNLVKSPKFRHACKGRHPELFENTGFPPSRERRKTMF